MLSSFFQNMEKINALSKKLKGGLGICQDAKPFEEEIEVHDEFYITKK